MYNILLSNNLDELLKDIEKPIIGWFCSYVPEEIIYAAGFHPYRIVGKSKNSGKANTYLPNYFCPYAITCLDNALNNEYSFLKGIIFTDSCNAMCRLYDIWSQYVNTEFNYIIDLPKVINNKSYDYFADGLKVLTAEIQKTFDIKISKSKLEESISLFNTTRNLLKRISDMILNELVDIKESEMLNIISASSYIERKIYNKHLQELIDKKTIKTKKQKSKKQKIMIAGGILPDIDIVKSIENYNAVVISDDMCTGKRYYDGYIEEGLNYFTALSRRYLGKIPCARMFESSNKRIKHIMKIINEKKVDGLIYFSLKFCISHSYDSVIYKDIFRKEGIPVLSIDIDYGKSSFEQIKTRIEAFLEML